MGPGTVAHRRVPPHTVATSAEYAATAAQTPCRWGVGEKAAPAHHAVITDSLRRMHGESQPLPWHSRGTAGQTAQPRS